MKNAIYSHLGMLVLRLNAGFFMLVNHGWPKFEKALAGGEIKFYDFLGIGPKLSLYLAIGGEFIASLLIILGLYTRLASLPAAFTMFIAGLVVHANDGLHKMETALLFFFMFTAIGLLGPGKFSLDYLIRKKS